MPTAPKPRDRKHDATGPVVCLAYAAGYVMCRRPGCEPFLLTLKDWNRLTPEFQIYCDRLVPLDKLPPKHPHYRPKED